MAGLVVRRIKGMGILVGVELGERLGWIRNDTSNCLINTINSDDFTSRYCIHLV